MMTSYPRQHWFHFFGLENTRNLRHVVRHHFPTLFLSKSDRRMTHTQNHTHTHTHRHVHLYTCVMCYHRYVVALFTQDHIHPCVLTRVTSCFPSHTLCHYTKALSTHTHTLADAQSNAHNMVTTQGLIRKLLSVVKLHVSIRVCVCVRVRKRK